MIERDEREDFIKLVTSASERKADADKRLRYYHDDQTEDLKKIIAKGWKGSRADYRYFCVNIVRKITNRLASVYSDFPVRTFDGANQERMEDLYAYARVNLELKKASRYLKLMKSGMLFVGWDGEGPTLSYVSPAILDVIHDGDPMRPTRVIITHRAARAEETTYSDWTATTYVRRDHRGIPLENPDNPKNVNPFGVLPFVPVFDRSPDTDFFLAGGQDLIEAQDAINTGLWSLWRALEWQSHGQLVLSGVGDDEDTPVSPAVAIKLRDSGAKGYFIQPNAPLEEVMRSIEFVLRQTAAAYDLSSDVFDLDTRAESGAAREAACADLKEARRDDLELWRISERRLFDVLRAVVNTYAPGTIPDAATIAVDFADPTESTSETERLKAAQVRVQMGVWSPVDVLMAENPDIQDREEALRILIERQQEAATLTANGGVL